MTYTLTQEERKELDSISDQEFGARLQTVTPDEVQIFTSTVEELFEQGFVASKDNYLRLWLAFNNSPHTPITRAVILKTTEVYRDSFAWKSEEELEFRKLDPTYATLVQTLLRRYGFFSTGEEGYRNAVLLTNYARSQGRQIDQNNFAQIVGNFANTPKGYRLSQLPNPDQRKAAKRWEESRNTEAPKRTAKEIAQAKADAVKHAFNPATGRKYSDEIWEEYYTNHPEPETPAAKPQTPATSPDEAVYEGRVRDFIRSIRSNITRERAEAEFGKGKYGNWQLTFIEIQDWYSKQGVK